MLPMTFQPINRLTLVKVLMAGVVMTASPAPGMVYMWRDSAGISHYTNKEYDIPDRYKAKAKPLYPEAADSAPGKPSAPGEPAKPVQQLPAVTVQPVAPDEKPKEAATPVVAAPPAEMPVAPVRRSRRPPRVHNSGDE